MTVRLIPVLNARERAFANKHPDSQLAKWAAEKAARCGHATIIGSYPGESHTSCDLPPRHDGDHEGTVYWEQGWPECGDCDPATPTVTT